jgi:hypothetical protein
MQGIGPTLVHPRPHKLLTSNPLMGGNGGCNYFKIRIFFRNKNLHNNIGVWGPGSGNLKSDTHVPV